MTKYIIKKCPSRVDTRNLKDICRSNNACCELVEDCLLKQIVEKCKSHSEICKECDSDDCFECEHLMAGKLVNKILSMLEIQESER